MGEEANLKNLSVDELKELKKERIEFMKTQIKDLKIQSEYSRLRADIAENMLREEMSKIKHASLKGVGEPEKSNDEH